MLGPLVRAENAKNRSVSQLLNDSHVELKLLYQLEWGTVLTVCCYQDISTGNMLRIM